MLNKKRKSKFHFDSFYFIGFNRISFGWNRHICKSTAVLFNPYRCFWPHEKMLCDQFSKAGTPKSIIVTYRSFFVFCRFSWAAKVFLFVFFLEFFIIDGCCLVQRYLFIRIIDHTEDQFGNGFITIYASIHAHRANDFYLTKFEPTTHIFNFFLVQFARMYSLQATFGISSQWTMYTACEHNSICFAN